MKLASLTVTGSAAVLTGNPIEFPNACTVSSASAFTCGVDISFTAASGSIFFNLHGSNSFQALNAGSRTVSVHLNKGTCTWNGPVTCAQYNMKQDWGDPATGTHIFAHANNQIAYLDDWRCVVKCGAIDCLKGTYVQLGYTFFGGNSDFHFGDYMGPSPLQAVDGTSNEITRLFATSPNICRPDRFPHHGRRRAACPRRLQRHGAAGPMTNCMKKAFRRAAE